MQWSQPRVTGSTPPPLAHHTVAQVGNVIYFIGGSSLGTAGETNDVLTFDTETMVWTAPKVTGDGPAGRLGLAAVAVEERIYTFGGSDGSQYFAGVHVLDTKTMDWSVPKTTGDGPSGRRGATASLVGNRIVIFGGSNGTALSDLFFFDLEKSSWSLANAGGAIPAGRLYTAAVVLGSKVHYFGGSDGTACFADMDVFDTANSSWSHVAFASSKCVCMHTASLVGNWVILLAGSDGDSFTDDFNVLNLQTLNWEKVHCSGTPPSPRGLHTTVLHDSRLFVFGGSNGETAFDDLFTIDLGCYAHLCLQTAPVEP